VRKLVTLLLYGLPILFALINLAYADGESFGERFLGSPLLVLVAVIIIDIIALIFHKLRK